MIKSYNVTVRKIAAEHGVFLWEVANVIGIPDYGLSRKLRKPLTEAEEVAMIAAILCIKEKKRDERKARNVERLRRSEGEKNETVSAHNDAEPRSI